MKNWKTTLSGILTASGLSMQASSDKTVQLIGWIVAAIGAAFLGAVSKDHNVTGGSTPQ